MSSVKKEIASPPSWLIHVPGLSHLALFQFMDLFVFTVSIIGSCSVAMYSGQWAHIKLMEALTNFIHCLNIYSHETLWMDRFKIHKKPLTLFAWQWSWDGDIVYWEQMFYVEVCSCWGLYKATIKNLVKFVKELYFV